MKKYILILFSVLLMSSAFVACDVETDEVAESTNVVKMAGHWTVTFEQSVDEYYYLFGGEEDPVLDSKTANELDALEWADIYGSGKVSVFTYNTAANTADEMWFSDYAASSSDASFWDYKLKVDVNYETGTFSCETTPNTSYEGCDITIVGGKILEGAATTPRGAAADSIVAYVKFSDDSNGFTFMKMAGYRYTGFDAD
jgi:hypothetical protein